MSVNDAIKVIDAVRESVGDKMTLMFDRNHGYNLDQALTVGQALDSNNFYWFEDPINPKNIKAVSYTHLRAHET